MNVEPESIHVARQWVEKAEEDITNAEHTLTLREGCPLGTICFHAQQCAEKYLKALLTLHSVPFPKTHDLPELLLQIPQHVQLGLQLADVAVINRYSVEARYPGDWEPITRVDAEEAVALVWKVREAVRAHLPKEAIP